MNENAFFALFAILLIAGFLGMVNGNLDGDVAKEVNGSKPTSGEYIDLSYNEVGSNSSYSSGSGANSGTYLSQGYGSSGNGNQVSSYNNLTTEERNDIKAELEDLYDEAWEIQQEIDKAKRQEPRSRYADRVKFNRSSASSVNVDTEYLTLTVASGGPINISDWYIESYVTEKRVAVPDGVFVYRDGGIINTKEPIYLKNKQRAFLITGESPLRVSFQENSCLGYITRKESFTPGSWLSCEDPYDLMLRYGDIELDDDSCHDFINGVRRCENVDDTNLEYSELSGKCRRFIDRYLTYNSCVDRFGNRTEFDDVNDWYIYFERDEELWRKKREIIRLMDEYDEVVAVLEY